MTNLGRALAAYQQKFDVENRLHAGDIGIAESTLTRVKQGKKPDADGFAKNHRVAAAPAAEQQTKVKP